MCSHSHLYKHTFKFKNLSTHLLPPCPVGSPQCGVLQFFQSPFTSSVLTSFCVGVVIIIILLGLCKRALQKPNTGFVEEKDVLILQPSGSLWANGDFKSTAARSVVLEPHRSLLDFSIFSAASSLLMFALLLNQD